MALRPKRNPMRSTNRQTIPPFGWYYHPSTKDVPCTNCSWCGAIGVDKNGARVCVTCDFAPLVPSGPDLEMTA